MTSGTQDAKMINDYDIRLVLGKNGVRLLSQDEDPWIRYSFDILLDEEDGPGQIVGSMQVSKLNIGEVYRRHIPLWEVFDDYSAETAECYCVVFDKRGKLRKHFRCSEYGQEDYLTNDFHFLNRIEIDESFKGEGLVGIATQIYLENFANGSDVAYMKAFPLQFEANAKPYKRQFFGAYKECLAKLCKYYEKLGFRRIGKTEHFFFVVDHFLSQRMELCHDR